MKAWILIWIALLSPKLCLAQTPPVVDVEVGHDWDADDARSSDPKYKQAHDSAKTREAYAKRIGSIKVEGRWVGDVKLPIAVGDVLTPTKIIDAMEALEKAITDNTVYGYGVRSKGEVGVLYIYVDFDTDGSPAGATGSAPDKSTVGLIFHCYYLGISLVQIGDRVLPIPRASVPTFYQYVPKPLLALNPIFGLTQDRAFGTALGGAFATDLLHLADPARISHGLDGEQHLDVHAQGRKSLQDLFYRGDAGLRYSMQRSGAVLQEFALRVDYDGVKEPLGDDQHTGHAGIGGIGAILKLAPNTRLSLDTGYQRTDDRMASNVTGVDTHTVANEQANRLLLDAIPWPVEGFLRAAMWEDNGWLTGGGAYQRLAGRFGYAKEIPLWPSQTIGFELLGGGGKAWGAVPAHALFFGGNSPVQFLYDSASSAPLLKMPIGPLIRSLGEGQGGIPTSQGVQGGNAFWHANLNLSFPIPLLSRALIPNEPTGIEDSQGRPLSLKQVLRNQIDVTGFNMLVATLTNEGMSPGDAQDRAKQILDEVKPATHFIIDNANLYSIKPLLMFDAGGVFGRGRRTSETWLAAGGGVQLTIVVAKLEAGYMQTVSGPTFGSRGNAFVRLVFQNLF